MRAPLPGHRARAVLAVTAVGVSSSVFGLFGTAQAAAPTWTASGNGPTAAVPAGICAVDWVLEGGAGGTAAVPGAPGGRLEVTTPVAEDDVFVLYPGTAGSAPTGDLGGPAGTNSSVEGGAAGGAAAIGGTGGGGGGAGSAVYRGQLSPSLFLSAFGGDGGAGVETDTTTSVAGGAGGGGDANTAATVTLTAGQQAATAAGSGNGSITGTGVPCDVPGEPLGLTVVPGDAQLEVSFTPAADAGDGMSDVTGWDISVDGGSTVHDQMAPADLTDTGGVLSTVLGSLQNGTEYTVAVRATSAAGEGSWAVASPETPVAAAVPAAPTLQSVDAGDASLIVQFTPGSGYGLPDATGYEYSVDDAAWATLGTTPTGGGFVGTIEGLTNGTTYPVRVRGIDGYLEGDPSAPLSGMPQGLPAAPTDVSVVAGDRSLGISFKPGVDPGDAMADPDGWEISTDGGANFRGLPVLPDGGSLRGTEGALANGTGYDVVLRATSAVGEGLPSSPVRGTPLATFVPPPAPVPALQAPYLNFAWGVDEGIEFSFDEYPVEGGPEATSFEYRIGSGSWAPVTVFEREGRRYGSISGLTNGTEYTFSIRGIGGGLQSLPSNTATATPRYVVPAPEDLVLDVLPGAIDVAWLAPVGAVGVLGYEVQAYPGDDPQSDSGMVSCSTGPADLECLLPVVAGQPYTVFVSGVSAEGLGDAIYTVSDVVPAVATPASVPTQDDGDLEGANGPVGTLTAGEKVVLRGSGFLPGSTVELIVYSTPVNLGSVTAGPDGSFSAEVTIPEGLAAGTHHLVATGLDPNGSVRNLVIEVTVDAAGTGTVTTIREELAYTGASIALPLGGGVLALLTGGGLLVTSRRRRATA